MALSFWHVRLSKYPKLDQPAHLVGWVMRTDDTAGRNPMWPILAVIVPTTMAAASMMLLPLSMLLLLISVVPGRGTALRPAGDLRPGLPALLLRRRILRGRLAGVMPKRLLLLLLALRVLLVLLLLLVVILSGLRSAEDPQQLLDDVDPRHGATATPRCEASSKHKKTAQVQDASSNILVKTGIDRSGAGPKAQTGGGSGSKCPIAYSPA